MASPFRDSRFVGRAEELGLLETSWCEAAAGRAVTWVVGGEAGVGKTRLLRELMRRAAADGGTALAGGCLDLPDGRLPLWPFVEALRSHMRGLDDERQAELLGRAAPELARILPELANPAAPTPSAEGPSAQGRLFELVLGLLGRLSAQSPLLLVIEDLHWADRSTRELLSFLARGLRSERVMMLASYRSDELYRGHPLRAFLAELHRARVVQRLDLRAFTRGELGEHLTSINGGRVDDALLDSVYDRSEGNPFFAEELVVASQDREHRELPSSLRDILLTRVEDRTAPAQEVLRIAAVGGRRVSDALLDAVCPIAPKERTEALRETVRHHLLVPDESGNYAFRHALLREAVYEELLPGERSDLHAAYGRALGESADLAGDPALVAGELAHHWYAAHDLPRALGASVQAGQAAAARWGFAEASGHFERALELWDRVPDAAARAGIDHLALSRRAAEAANLAGDHARAGALMRGAITRANAADAGLLWERLGRYLWAAGDSDAAVGAYEEALRLVPQAPPSAARARVLAAHGQSLMLLARFEAASARCREAIEVARAVRARAEEGHALNTLGCALAFLGQPADAVDYLRQALEIAREVGDLDDLGRAYQNLSEILGGPLNRLEEALEVAREGQRMTEQVGLARDYGVSLEVNAATALLSAGDWAAADGILRRTESRRPLETSALDMHLCRARLDLGRGDLDDATHHLECAQALMTKTLDPQFHSMLCARRAELALWERRPLDARDAVARGLTSLDDADDEWFIGPLLWLGAWAEADLGGADESLLARAARLVDSATAGERFVSPVTVGYAQLAQAEGGRATGADASPWRAAAGAWCAAGHPYPHAYALWRAAEALLARRHGREGAAVLRQAHGMSEALGARPLAREIALLAGRARVDLALPAGPPAPADADPIHELGLTPRERQVLGLVADGRTNREIAQELFVTEKTAGAHVSNILAKLGVRSRVEAATAAHRLGVLDERQRA